MSLTPKWERWNHEPAESDAEWSLGKYEIYRKEWPDDWCYELKKDGVLIREGHQDDLMVFAEQLTDGEGVYADE